MTHALPGCGSKFNMSAASAGPWQPVAQLKSFVPQGSKAIVIDRTNISTPDNFTRPLSVRIDSGEIDLMGILDPQNTGILQLGTAHANVGVLYYFKVVLTDGTTYTFQGFVSEYVPFNVSATKAIGFSAKIRVSGAYTGPAGSA